LEAYVLVEQDRMAVTILRRAEVGWQAEQLQGADAVLRIPSIGVELPLERIYERTSANRGGNPG
jgi:hypothetical protein